MTDETQPRVVDNRQASRFELRVGERVAGFTAYERNGSTMTLTHTEVDPSFKGRGLGSALARGTLDAARAEAAVVLPYCPFIRGYIERHPEYVDLVPGDQRSRFGLG